MDMIFCPLYSGSSGNALFVQYGGTQHVILGHLSGENNTPALARRVSEERMLREGVKLGEELFLDVARRDQVGSVYTLEADV